MKILKDIPLAQYTTFNIGGEADYFCQAKTEEDIFKAINWAKKKKIDYYILGNGSNVLIADKGVRGLVIKIISKGYEVKGKYIYAQAGLLLSDLLQIALKNNLSGLEFLAGIPGTVAGAVYNNAGTKRDSISNHVEKITFIDENAKINDLNSRQCQFDYRTSCFQNTKNIILEAVFKLQKEKKAVIKKKISQALKARKKQPKGKNIGSIFKNPKIAPAGYLIENAGFKGKKIGQAIVSEKHANWIINLGNAKASDVLKLISSIKKKVKKDFKVELKEEIVMIGDF